MPTTNEPMHYGFFVGICQVCFKQRKRFGTLIDPNGHSWLVCNKCINRLWKKRQALRNEDVLTGES
jgi:hypothetical protein